MVQSQDLAFWGKTLGPACSPQEASSHLSLSRGTDWTGLSGLINITSYTEHPRYSNRNGKESLVFLDYQVCVQFFLVVWPFFLYDWHCQVCPECLQYLNFPGQVNWAVSSSIWPGNQVSCWLLAEAVGMWSHFCFSFLSGSFFRRWEGRVETPWTDTEIFYI